MEPMLITSRTSEGMGSQQRADRALQDWERECLNALPLVSNNEAFSVWLDCCDDIVSFEFPSDEVRCTVDLDPAVTVHLPDEGYLPPCNGQGEIPPVVGIVREPEVLRQMSEASRRTPGNLLPCSCPARARCGLR